MAKSFRELKKSVDSKLMQKEYSTDEQNRVLINMNVKNDSGFLSEFSSQKTPVISSSVAEFLSESVYGVPLNNGVKLTVESDCIDEVEQVEYEKAIREYYSEKYVSNEKELKRNYAISFILAVFGVLVLAIAIFIELKFEMVIWSEVIDIVAWVFLWEATDVLFFRSRELRNNRRKCLAFLSMDIKFISNKKDTISA